MNAKHLTTEVRKQIILAEKSYRVLQKEKRDEGDEKLWETDQESKKWMNQFYHSVSKVLTLNEFVELLLLEVNHNFVSGYVGGAVLSQEGCTKIIINDNE